MPTIGTDYQSLNILRNLRATTHQLGSVTERLATGLRVNRAADDAAGLAISETLNAQIRGLSQAIRNSQDGVSLLQTADSALAETYDLLARLRDLALQASSDVLTDIDRAAIQTEADQLIDAVDNIATSVSFNSRTLLDGTLVGQTVTPTLDGVNLTSANGCTAVEATEPAEVSSPQYNVTVDTGTASGFKITVTDASTGDAQTIDNVDAPAAGETAVVDFELFGLSMTLNEDLATITTPLTGQIDVDITDTPFNIQVGPNGGAYSTITLGDTQSAALGIDAISLATTDDAEAAITTIDDAILNIASQQAQVGGTQNGLESITSILSQTFVDTAAARQRIVEADIAYETVNLVRLDIVQQAGLAVLAQANLSRGRVLNLLTSL